MRRGEDSASADRSMQPSQPRDDIERADLSGQSRLAKNASATFDFLSNEAFMHKTHELVNAATECAKCSSRCCLAFACQKKPPDLPRLSATWDR
jgi:hypothetical protein